MEHSKEEMKHEELQNKSHGSENKATEKCPACGFETEQLMRHLRKKECREKLGESKLNELRQAALKVKYQTYNRSEKRKMSLEKYHITEKFLYNQRKYNNSDKGRARNKRHYEKVKKCKIQEEALDSTSQV